MTVMNGIDPALPIEDQAFSRTDAVWCQEAMKAATAAPMIRPSTSQVIQEPIGLPSETMGLR